MFVCNTITFESLDLESSSFGMQVHLQGIQVKFVYEGHRVKVKVTGAIPPCPGLSESITATAVTASPFQSENDATTRHGRAALHTDTAGTVAVCNYIAVLHPASRACGLHIFRSADKPCID